MNIESRVQSPHFHIYNIFHLFVLLKLRRCFYFLSYLVRALRASRLASAQVSSFSVISVALIRPDITARNFPDNINFGRAPTASEYPILKQRSNHYSCRDIYAHSCSKPFSIGRKPCSNSKTHVQIVKFTCRLNMGIGRRHWSMRRDVMCFVETNWLPLKKLRGFG